MQEVKSKGRWKVLLIRVIFSPLLAWGFEAVVAVFLGRLG